MYTGCNLWETHVSCRVLLDTIQISFSVIFFLFLLPFLFPYCLNSSFAFHSPSFVRFRFLFHFGYFFIIWTVVHLIGCTGLLGTDNWLANNSSNNIRAYDIQVLIYTLHRYFFVFVFRSNHIFGACPCVWAYASLVDLHTSLCRDVARNAGCSATYRHSFCFFFIVICQIKI